MTRLYREGRTETVRSCTVESAAWVKAMENKSVSVAEKVRLLQEACRRHQTGFIDAMCGRGVDRHLFCLLIVSKYLKVDSPFLQAAVGEPWRLSTSQTPMGQIDRIDFKKNPGFLNPGAGFGPVTYDGYSVSYIVSGEDLLSFHVSSKRSCPITDSSRFIDRIVQAMADIRTLFKNYRRELVSQWMNSGVVFLCRTLLVIKNGFFHQFFVLTSPWTVAYFLTVLPICNSTEFLTTACFGSTR